MLPPTKTVNSNLTTLQYTGAQVVGSVHWDFGDDSTTRSITPIQPVTHCYADGNYKVCAIGYTACGNDSVCDNVYFKTTSINNIAGANDVFIYPNPASSVINIQSAMPVNATISSIEGKMLFADERCAKDGYKQFSRWYLLIADCGCSRQNIKD